MSSHDAFKTGMRAAVPEEFLVCLSHRRPIALLIKWQSQLALVLPYTLQTCMSQGRLLQEEQIDSHHLGGTRAIRVCLPPSYDREPRRHYPVLYLHDGQNVFSSAGTNACFGWGGWDLDVAVNNLCAANQMEEIIMVGVDNSQARYKEYSGPAWPITPEMPRAKARAADKDQAYQNYTRFLIKDLKPRIDGEHRTLTGPGSTGVMGASLGGICSLALAWEHPRTFGLAASLSGSFQVERANFLRNVLQAYRGKRKPLRLYLDSGTIDFTGDDDGRKYTQRVAAELRRLGWRDEVDLRHFVDAKPLSEAELERSGLRRDKWQEARTSQHNEFYWRRRVWRALVFLFPPK